jgi:hypothetical protein
MTPSGIDYFARLIRTVAVSATEQRESRALVELAEALIRLPSESNQRVAYNSVMDHAAALKFGPSIKDVEEDHIEEYRLSYPEADDPKLFLENLILDIDSLIEDAEVSVNEGGCECPTEQTDDTANGRANEIAREIASKKAKEGAREAAEEAYKLAYEWAYDDLFEEAYQRALLQLSDSSTVQRRASRPPHRHL